MADIFIRENNIVKKYVDQLDGSYAEQIAANITANIPPISWVGFPGLEPSDFPLPITAPNPIPITSTNPLEITATVPIPITASAPIEITSSTALDVTASNPLDVALDPSLILKINFKFASQQTIAINTNASDGTQFVTFPSLLTTGSFEIFNYTGTDLEFRTNADTVFLAIPQGSGRLFPGISNANQVSVRRRDLTNSSVAVKAIVYTV